MTAAGGAVLETLLEKGFLQQVRDTGQYMREGLARLANSYAQGELRGQGLFWG